MKRKKGFTLVELLAVIVLISLLLIITISSIQNVNRNSKSKLCRTKLSLIEDAVNLYLTNNPECFFNSDESNNCYSQICSKLSKDSNNNDTCITSVNNLVELGIVEKDKDDIVINPLNKKDMGNYNVLISYNNKLNVFETHFLDEDDTIDKNYIKRCGEIKSGIIEDESEKNKKFNLKSDYFDVNIYIDGDEDSPYSAGPKKDVYKSKIGTSCQQFLSEKFSSIPRDDADNYQIQSYTEKDNILNCYFTEKEKPSIHILYDTKAIKITNGIKDEDTYEPNPDEPIEIKYDFISDEYRLDNISCSPNVCDIDRDNNKIKVNLKYDNVIVEIKTDKKYVLNYYINDPNGSDDNYFPYDSSKDTILNDLIKNGIPVNSVEEAKQICEKNMDANLFTSSSIDKEYGNKAYRCKYNRKKFKINLLTDTNILKSQSRINGEEIRQEYKWGQTIKIKFRFKDNYYFGYIDENNTTKNIDFNVPKDILINKYYYDTDQDIITFTMPDKDVKLSVKSGEGFNMTLYNNFQNANNEDGYEAYKVGENTIFIVISNNDYLSYIYSFCGKEGYKKDGIDYGNYTLNSNYNYFSKNSSEINCYYDRKTVNIRVEKEVDEINSRIIINPNNAQISKSETIEYRYGETIMFKLVSDLTDIKTNIKIKDKYNKLYNCQDYKGCTSDNNGTYKIKEVTEDIKLIPEIKESFKIYKYYQNADNKDGYDLKFIDNTGEINSADSSKLELKNLCKNIDNNYAFEETISYIVRTNHEINCYYNRNTVKITFDKSDEKLKQYSIAPHTKDDLSNYTITKNETLTYRYGQNIILSKYMFEDYYDADEIKCIDKNENTITDSEICNVASTGKTKIKAKQSMTVKPMTKPKEEMYDVYFYYQNADNKGGYNIENHKTQLITLKDEYIKKIAKSCNISDATYDFNASLSYIANDAHKINCYYDRKTVKLKYSIDSKISSFGYAPANNNTISIGTTNNSTREYRYGQNIILKINKYNTGYSFENFYVKCTENYVTCLGVNDVIKINITDKQNIPDNLEVTITKKESE